jgi:hypothetical protein
MKIFLSIHKINLKKVIMSILDKIRTPQVEEPNSFTAEECKFLLLKLRSATYTGHEFETFYNIWVKITKELEKLEK